MKSQRRSQNRKSKWGIPHSSEASRRGGRHGSVRERRRLGPIPDSVLADGIFWDDSDQARQDEAQYQKACRELEAKWTAVRAVEAEITAAWRRDAGRQIAEVSPSIERDQHELLLSRLDEQMKARHEAEDKITAQYLNDLLAVRERLWRQQAERRLAAATRSINRDIARKERQLFFGR